MVHACPARARHRRNSNFEQAARARRTHLSRRAGKAGRNDEWRYKMKKLVLAAALATLVATPAFAQYQSTYAPRHAGADSLAGIRAQAQPSVRGDAVYVNGQYVGADPDPNVRLELRRDIPSNY
jgi:hypothetical protein